MKYCKNVDQNGFARIWTCDRLETNANALKKGNAGCTIKLTAYLEPELIHILFTNTDEMRFKSCIVLSISNADSISVTLFFSLS